MKIAQIITRSDTIGGAHIHLKDLALALIEKGHDVLIFVGQCGPFTDVLDKAGVPYRSLCYLKRPINPLDDFKALLELKKEIRAFKPDIVACHSSKAGWLGRIASTIVGIPVVFTAHGWSFTDGVSPLKSYIYRCAEKFAGKFTNHIITVSDYDRELALQYRIADKKKITTILNGMPDISYELKSNPSLPLIKLIMVARFDIQKNHTDLLYALSYLKDLPWSLDFIGDGPLEPDIVNLVTYLGLSERVNFLGLREDVSDLLAKAQIFILISNWEGLPLSILEAMRAGLPVIASDVGGVKESVEDSKTGFLIKRGDVSLLRDRLFELIENDELRVSMGKVGRRSYEKNFILDRMVKHTLSLYKKVLKREI